MKYNVIFTAIFFIQLWYSIQGSVQWDVSLPNAFDQKLYEEVLDAELCQEQLEYIVLNDTLLRTRLLDAGIRIPRGIFDYNIVDMGNYYQCLDIKREINTAVPSMVEGKYCSVNVPIFQDLQLPTLPNFTLPLLWSDLIELDYLRNDKSWLQDFWKINRFRSDVQTFVGSGVDLDLGIDVEFDLTLAVCIPKACTTRQAVDYLYFNTSFVGLEFTDNYCRLPNDKPWVAADYVATTIFSVIGLITLISTAYDLYHTYHRKQDPKTVKCVYRIFSLYTNTQQALTFPTNPNSITCLDGIRSIAMMWVIIAHTFLAQISGNIANPLNLLQWGDSIESLWITSSFISVDTFFLLSGILIVYTTVGKFSSMKLLKNIHLFYLNRILRMFPILATAVLLQASFFNRVADGPYWETMAHETHKCRNLWWSTLLYIHNYFDPSRLCFTHTWYLAIDVQLHILSPLVLFWVLKGHKPLSWGVMTAALLAILTAATVYNFHMDFPSGSVLRNQAQGESSRYIQYFYFNTLTRASPFFVGMLVGYLLHITRGKKLNISKLQVTLLWLSTILFGSLCIYIHYPINHSEWDNQTMNNLVNSFQRPIWATSLGWIIIACVHGYSGPINWFLSLPVWKLPARLSYAMYILHYPLVFMISATSIAPIFFSVPSAIFKFFADFTLVFIVAFLATVLIDVPFASIIKIVIGGRTGSALPREPKENGNGQKL